MPRGAIQDRKARSRQGRSERKVETSAAAGRTKSLLVCNDGRPHPDEGHERRVRGPGDSPGLEEDRCVSGSGTGARVDGDRRGSRMVRFMKAEDHCGGSKRSVVTH